jgi:hypothetical protein
MNSPSLGDFNAIRCVERACTESFTQRDSGTLSPLSINISYVVAKSKDTNGPGCVLLANVAKFVILFVPLSKKFILLVQFLEICPILDLGSYGITSFTSLR